MRMGDTAMKYSVMQKIREVAVCASMLRPHFEARLVTVLHSDSAANASLLVFSTALFACCFGYASYARAIEIRQKPAWPAEIHQPSRPAMSAISALREIREALQQGRISVNRGSFFGCVGIKKYEDVHVTFSQVSFTVVEECENSMYNSPPESESLQFNRPVDLERIERLGHTLGFAAAVNAVRYYSSGADLADDTSAFATFQDEARQWRALPVKPMFSEAVRRFNVLAEDAIKRQNFEEAIDYYEQGLAILPLWPEGQFNAALLYEEFRLYGQAILHMKRYLELSPNAQDAQAARDKVIVWEEKVKQMGVR
jgi:tetratricopeptide (TPR) repeat protein